MTGETAPSENCILELSRAAENAISLIERLKRTERNVGHLLALMRDRPTESHSLVYTNYRGETSKRELHLVRIWYGKTDWHPEPQLLMKAFDIEKNAYRDFAVADFKIDA